MKLFNQVPDSQISQPGLERAVLKKLPMALLASICLPLMMSFGSRLFPPQGSAEEVSAYFTQIDILALSGGVIAWMTILTIAITCAFVILLKGPAYVADAYHLKEAEQPLR